MKRFIIKLVIFLSPLLIILCIYAYKDPFKVLYHYDEYFSARDSFYFELDDDYISTQTLIQKHPKYNYDSYIFGSSRSDNYQVSEWSKHIHSNSCFHYNAAYESLYGVERKMQLLKKRKYPIKNALFIIDDDLLCNVNNDKGHIRIKHPLLSGQSMLGFQAEFLKDFFDKDFLYAYLDLLYSGHLKPYMVQKGLMGVDRFHYKAVANELLQSEIEAQIISDSNRYYADRHNVFYTRDSIIPYGEPVIKNDQKKLLERIKDILTENHTSYRIVISPLYNQVKMDSNDLKTLQAIFGNENVFDFSGINAITDNKYNYYETSHYRPRVCTEIMNSIYTD